MRVTYKPEGADPREWTFRPGKLLNVEAEEVERRTGMDFSTWVQKLPPLTVNMTALHGLLYVLLKREIPTLKYDEVGFAADDLDFELELDEKQNAVDMMRKALNDGEVEASDVEDVTTAMRALEAEIEAEAGDAPAGDPAAPKAEPASETNGGPPSLSTSTPLHLSSTA